MARDAVAAAAVQHGRGPLCGDPARDAERGRLGDPAFERPCVRGEAAAAVLGDGLEPAAGGAERIRRASVYRAVRPCRGAHRSADREPALGSRGRLARRRAAGKHALVSRHGTAADAGYEPDLVHDAGARGISASAAGGRSRRGRSQPQGAGVRRRQRREHGWMLLAWIATALGVLTKGLVAAALPAAVLVLYSLYARDWSPWRRLHASIGLPLFLAIATPWYWLAAQRLPDFLQFFFVHEHLARYLTPSADREEAWWFFGAVFLLGSMPWTLPALRALFQGWRRPSPGAGFNATLFLRIWVLFVCLFFSVSSSKLIPYILPAFPALALLTADLPTDVFERDLARTALLTLGCAIALAATCLFAPRYVAPSDRSAYFLALAKPLAQIALLLAASALYVMSQRRRDLTRATVFLGAGWCLSGLLMMRAAAAVAPVYSGVTLARALPGVPRDIPVYSVATYDQTLPVLLAPHGRARRLSRRARLRVAVRSASRAAEPRGIHGALERGIERLCGDGEEDVRRARRPRRADAGARPRCEPSAGGAALSATENPMKPFLPFVRPSIDEASIAAVADVFRSGQLASGPKVQAFEAALAAYLGSNRHVRVMTSATAGLRWRSRSPASGWAMR